MKESASSRVLSGASRMGAAVFVSRIMGLVREQVFAGLFGAGAAMDAFAVAFRIPNLLRDLFAEGAMSSALVPTFVKAREKEGIERAWRVAARVFIVLFLVVSAITVGAYFFVEDLIRLYASSFSETPGKFELTVSLTQIMFPFFPLVALAAAFMAILNALGAFFIPAFSSALFNLVSVVSGVLLVLAFESTGLLPPIAGMAIGVVIGGAVQAFSQWPMLRRMGYRHLPRLADEPPVRRDPYLRQMMVLMIPGTLGMAGTQINILVNTMLATGAGEGAVSWLQYAFRLMQFPIGLFGVSLAAATLPAVSRAWAQNDFDELNLTLSSSLRRVIAVNLPASVGLAVLAIPIIELLFQYGAFERSDTLSTALALQGYAIGLPFYSLVKVLVPAFYGIGNTRIPVISSILSVVTNIGLNLWWVQVFGFVGLALGTSVAAFVNAAFLFVVLRWKLRAVGAGLKGSEIFLSFLKTLVVTGIMGGACFGASLLVLDVPILVEFLPVVVARAAQVGVLVAVGVAALLLSSRLIQARDTLEIFEFLRRKLFRSGSK